MTDTLTHALTIRHPFAYAVAAGWKPVENKDKRPPLALIGQLVGIHAGLQWARKSDLPSWAKSYEMPAPTDSRLVYGALIGVAMLVGVVRIHPVTARMHFLFTRSDLGEAVPEEMAARIRPWWRGPWGWLLDEAVLLPEPIPMRGQQGLWRIPTILPHRYPDGSIDHSGGPIDPRNVALEQWRKASGTT